MVLWSRGYEERHSSCKMTSTISCERDMNGVEHEEVSQVQDHPNPEVTLLDNWRGAMSTGLCLRTDLFGLYFVTRWAVNLNQYACESLKLNHPEIEVRNDSAEDFLLWLMMVVVMIMIVMRLMGKMRRCLKLRRY